MMKVFAKGLVMGACDLVPGVSGGTIAFITGIYERLIRAVKNLSWGLLREAITHWKHPKGLADCLKRADIPFLIVLGTGIGTAILLGSRGIAYLLEHHTSATLSFFIGLILASTNTIIRHIKWTRTAAITSLAGLLAGIIIAFLSPTSIIPTLPYLTLSGFLAISAMFLPGISGSFILLILGVYEYLLNSLHEINIAAIASFMLGAGIGVLAISRAITWLFNKNKNATLSTLLGLVIGSLGVPLKHALPADYSFLIYVGAGALAGWALDKASR